MKRLILLTFLFLANLQAQSNFLFFYGDDKVTYQDSLKVLYDGTNIYVRSNFNDTYDVVIKCGLQTSDNELFGLTDVRLISAKAENSSSVFDAGTNIHTITDDIAPVQTMAGFLGANHGFNANKLTCAGHDKTSADIGSIWSDGTRQWYLAQITGNYLYMVSVPYIYDGAWIMTVSIGASPLTHVSGATHTDDITYSAKTTEQQYPVVKNVTHQFLLDGTKTLGAGFNVCDSLEVIESYYIVDPSTYTYAVPFTWDDGELWLKMDIHYKFFKNGTVLTYHTWYNLRDYRMGYLGFTQATKIAKGSYDKVLVYAPKTLDCSDGTKTWNFQNIEDMTTNPTSDIYFVDSTQANSSRPMNRLYEFLADSDDSLKVGFVHGYIQSQGDGTDVVRDSANNRFWHIGTTGKSYPHFIDKEYQIVDSLITYNVVTYRAYFDPYKNSDYGIINVYRLENGSYEVVIDYLQVVSKDTLTLPINNCSIEVIEKTDSLNLYSDTYITDSRIYVGATGKGSAILKLTPTTTIPSDVTAPHTPANLAAVGATGKITLTWDAVLDDDLQGYYIYAGTSTNPATLLDSVMKGTETWDTTLVGGIVNHYRVKSFDDAWNLSGYSSSVSDTSLPVIPTNLTVDYDQINLTADISWDAIIADSVRIYRGTSTDPTTWLASTGANTPYNDTGLEEGVTYYYRVKALKGSTLSGYSINKNTEPDVTAPSAPTGLSVIASGGSSRVGTVTLTWTDPTDEDLGKIYIYKGTSTDPTALYDSVNAGVQTKVYTTDTSNIYYYRLKARDLVYNNSGYTSTASDTVYEFEVARYLNACTVSMHDSVKYNINFRFVKPIKDTLNIDSLALRFDAGYLWAISDSNNSKLNLVKRTDGDITTGGTCTFTPFEGWQSNGTTGYLNTNMNLSTDMTVYQRNDASSMIYNRTYQTADNNDYGAVDGAGAGLSMEIELSTWSYLRFNSAYAQANTGANSVGLHILTRADADSFQYFKNGSKVYVTTQKISLALPNLNVYCLGRNSNGTPALFTTRQYSTFFLGKNLTATEVGYLNAVIEGYMDRIGKGVQ